MKEIFIAKDGHARSGVRRTCEFCDKEFLTRADQPGKFCSRDCRCNSRKRQTSCLCDFCGKIFSRPNSKVDSKSGHLFCSRKCKDIAQRIENEFIEMWPAHYNKSVEATRQPEVYRRIYMEKYQLNKLVCSRCGYCEFECGIDIHHRDGDFKNNKKENLCALCSPCHRGLHMKLWNIDEL